MIKHITTLSVLLASLQLANGQTGHIEKEIWAAKPVIHTLDDKYSKESAVVLLDKRRVEYIDEPKDVLAQYYTLHKLIHIIDDRGIESFNKIYLGFSENSDVVDIKARAILPGGKIIDLDKNNIKEQKDDDGGVYKIFAMDGLIKGCEVEYYYTFKKELSFFGTENVQSSSPVKETTFQLISPPRLKFDIKTYNGTAVITDTVVGEKKILECIYKDTPGAEDEKYAFYYANLKRLEFKLAYNTATQKDARLFTWNEMAKRVYNMYATSADKDGKKVSDMVAKNGWAKLPDEQQKVIAVEKLHKKEFFLQ